jgi:hypothetical protein
MKSMKGPILVLGLACALATSAAAQGTRYDVKTINFDMWCQEQAKLPPSRCDQRLPQDEATFDAYRSKIEQYETDYLREKSDEDNFNRAIINRDELDKTSMDRNPAPQTPQPPPKPAP